MLAAWPHPSPWLQMDSPMLAIKKMNDALDMRHRLAICGNILQSRPRESQGTDDDSDDLPPCRACSHPPRGTSGMVTCALCIAKRLSQVASSTTRHKSFATTETGQTDHPELVARDTQRAFPEGLPVLPERRSQKAFATMLPKVVKDEAHDEGDRTIGDYTMDDEQWLEWKRGGRTPSPVDEYESDENESDGSMNGNHYDSLE
ncbi:hypothetical protein BC827DRAFT_1269511 [Russula dissimulans]|nr:hypothetical protein BC827DRAFT_1269511 [Russula dissimulans]